MFHMKHSEVLNVNELDFYTKAEVNDMFGVTETEDTGRDFYTKAEIIEKVGTPETLVLPADMLDFYTKTEIDSIATNPYTMLSFIQSTNRQTINTGYVPNENTRIEGIFMLFSNYTQSGYITQALFGAYDDFYLRNAYSGTNLTSTFKCGSQTITQPILTPYSKKIRIVADVNGVTVYDMNGTALGSISVSGGTISTSFPIFIFSKSSTTEQDSYADGRIYSFKIYENNVLVRDFVPAKRNNDGACGMLEQVSGTFYTDANPDNYGFYSDAFSDNYTTLDTVETAGDLYVDTGYIHKTNTRITIDSVPDISGSGVTALDSCLFGSNYNMQYGSDMWVLWDRTLVSGGVPAFRRGADVTKYADCSAMNFRTRSTIVAEGLTMTMTYPDSTSVTVTQTDGEINSGINTMYLFWENVSPDTSLTYQRSYTRFYSAQISEITNGEETLVRDLIPVKRKGDNIITLYDRVTTAEFGAFGGSFAEVS